MVENTTAKERRGIIQTLVDPKTLPTLIPILLAVGSAFMVHDRSINTLQVTVQQHERIIGTNTNRAETVRDIQSRLGILESAISNFAADHREFSEEIRELHKLTTSLQQSVMFDERQVGDILVRLRALETKANHHP